MRKTFFEWVKDPQAEEKQKLELIRQGNELLKKKKQEMEAEEKRRRDSDDLGFLMASVAGAI